MNKDIIITLYNKGLRSYIEVDLCVSCPRQDDKGCCGYYSPVFYPLDIAYLYVNHPEVMEQVWAMEHITVLDASVTINSPPEHSGYHCRFHSKEAGCVLPQTSRESVCRQFVCTGVDWQQEEALTPWKEFFQALEDYEIQLNSSISEQLRQKGLSLRDKTQRPLFINALIELYHQAITVMPYFIYTVPSRQSAKLYRPITFKEEWIL